MVAKDTKKEMGTESINPYGKPPNQTKAQSIKKFIYNSETGAFMGRTASSWGKFFINL